MGSSSARRARRPVFSAAISVDPDVLEAVSRLSVRQRAVVFLTYWEDLHQRDIATRLDISEGSVRRHLARAHSRLKETLDA